MTGIAEAIDLFARDLLEALGRLLFGRGGAGPSTRAVSRRA